MTTGTVLNGRGPIASARPGTPVIVNGYAAAVVGNLLSKFLKAAGLSGVDRTLGGLFGLARGVVILLAFTIVAGLTSLPRQPVWKESVAAGMATRTVVQLTSWLPPALAGRLKYN